MEVKGPAEIKMFCKDFVEDAEVMFVLATAACVLVIVSLVHFLMALSANYAHIRGHDKFTELQDLQVQQINNYCPKNKRSEMNKMPQLGVSEIHDISFCCIAWHVRENYSSSFLLSEKLFFDQGRSLSILLKFQYCTNLFYFPHSGPDERNHDTD